MKKKAISLIGAGLIAAAGITAGLLSYKSQKKDEMLFASPPPVDFRTTAPIKAGNFNPQDWRALPEYFAPYESETAGLKFPLTLEQVLEKESPEMTKFVRTTPEKSEIEKKENIFVYATAIGNNSNPDDETRTWCIPCNELHEKKAYEKIESEIKKSDNWGLIKLLHPPSQNQPSFFTVIEGVPSLLIYKNINGELKEAGNIIAPNAQLRIEKALQEIRTINQEGKSIRFYKDDLKSLKVHYGTEKDSFQDHLAILLAHTNFGEERLTFDKDLEDFIFTADLSDPDMFMHVLNFDENLLRTPQEGRNFLISIGDRVAKYSIGAKHENPAFKEYDDWLHSNIVKVRRKMTPEMPGYYEKFRATFEAFAAMTKECYPPYIKDFYEAHLKNAKEKFSGDTNKFQFVTELTSEKFQTELREWAQKNNILIEERNLPTLEEIAGWKESQNLSDAAVQVLQQSRTRISEDLGYLSSLGISYAFTAPKPIIEKIVNSKEYALIRISNSPFEEDLTEIENYKKRVGLEHSGKFSMTPLLALACDQPTNKALIYLPNVKTGLDLTEPLDTSVTRYGDGLGGDQDAPALILLKKGRFVYTPFETNSTKEAIEKIKEITR